MARLDISTNSIGSTRLQRVGREDLTPAQYAMFQDINTMADCLVNELGYDPKVVNVLSKNDMANAIRIAIDKGDLNPEPEPDPDPDNGTESTGGTGDIF